MIIMWILTHKLDNSTELVFAQIEMILFSESVDLIELMVSLESRNEANTIRHQYHILQLARSPAKQIYYSTLKTTKISSNRSTIPND